VRAAVYPGNGESLRVEQVTDPTPGPRQAVVRVEACGICGTDLSVTSGHGALQAHPGDVPGHEYAGEVVAVGNDVDRLAVGDRICSMAIWGACGRCESCRTGNEQWCTGQEEDKAIGCASAFAEYALVGETVAVKLRDDLSWIDGALVEPTAVGLHAVDLSDLRPGTDIAVIGAGPIALATIYWARRRGAGRIVVAATSNRRERIARLLGATEFVTGDDPTGEVTDLAGGPPRVVFETAGVPGTIALALDMVAPRGIVTVLGCCTEPQNLLTMSALFKQVRVQFSFTYGSGDFQTVMRALAADHGGPREIVTSEVPLEQLPAVMDDLRGPSDECKVVIDPQL
jgi:(R,R)-butanediol dehydrogenase/meso-butanediol dehydrogenase/diacetyl reductase